MLCMYTVFSWKIRPGKFAPEENSPPENSPLGIFAPYRVIQYATKFQITGLVFIKCVPKDTSKDTSKDMS